jgi:stage V sporulation protein R
LERKKKLRLPEENLLHFIKLYSPILKTWQRDILDIVSNVAQYFYPQKQTKVMNEGCACFVHFYIVNALYDKGLLSEGAMLEILHSHSNVLAQPDFDDQRYGGINPYALGFAMMEDIRRICEDPTEEDKEWFPEIAGSKDWRSVLKNAWANYRDESFIQQFLSPKLMRQFRLFTLSDDSEDKFYSVSAIHNKRGYRKVRDSLAQSYDIAVLDPDIQVVDVDLLGDRQLRLKHTMRDSIPLEERDRDRVLAHLKTLWGYDVVLES